MWNVQVHNRLEVDKIALMYRRNAMHTNSFSPHAVGPILQLPTICGFPKMSWTLNVRLAKFSVAQHALSSPHSTNLLLMA